MRRFAALVICGLFAAGRACADPQPNISAPLLPDNVNSARSVSIWCPTQDQFGAWHAGACSFGSGTGGGGGTGGAVTQSGAWAVSLLQNSAAVGASNRLQMTDAAVDALISGGALTVAGAVTISGTPSVTISGTPSVQLQAGSAAIGSVAQSGTWSVGLSGAIPAGSNAIGAVSVSNFPATQAVSGNVGITGTANVAGTVAVSSLPALPAGSNTIGTVGLAAGAVGSVTSSGTSGTVAQAVQGSNNMFPLTINGAVSQGGTWNVGVTSLPALPAGSNAIGQVTVSNLPATQAVSLASLPALASGTNTIGAVTISGTPSVSCTNCSGGGGSSGGPATESGTWNVGITYGGSVVSSSNLFGVTDAALDALISNGKLAVVDSGSVSLAAGSAAIGSVSVSNLPATQAVSGTVGLAAGSAAIGTVGVSSLPALPAGSNAIGTVSVSNLPATQAVSGTVGLAAGSAAIGTVGVSSLPALPAGSNAIGTVSVSNLPATQAISSTTNTPVAPGTATATNAGLVGCLANTTLPSFTAGQQGAVPCDTSGRLYVVTVPSANNVPGYLQAVASGGATPVSFINAASSAMATVVKAGGGMVYGYDVCNAGTAASYFRLFNQTAAPTVGTSTPILRDVVPAGSCARFESPVGVALGTGIGFDVTTGSLADSDTSTIATASTVTVQVFYK